MCGSRVTVGVRGAGKARVVVGCGVVLDGVSEIAERDVETRG